MRAVHIGVKSDNQDKVQSWMVQVNLHFSTRSNSWVLFQLLKISFNSSLLSIYKFLQRVKTFLVLVIAKITSVVNRLRGHLRDTSYPQHHQNPAISMV